MTESKKLELRRSQIAKRLTELAATDEVTEDATAEVAALTKEAGDVETRWQAAVSAERMAEALPAPPDGKADPELMELRSRAQLSSYFSAAVNGKDVGGAEAELRDALIPDAPGDHFPLAMLAPPEALETRATDTTAVAGPELMRPILPRVFETKVTNALGIVPEMVPVSQAQYVVMTSGVSPAQTAEGAEKAAEDGGFAVSTLTPKRLSASYEVTGEVLLQVPNLEDALRSDLSMALANEMEKQILVGNGTSPNVSGITHGETKAAVPGAVVTYNEIIAAASQQVDGVFASTADAVTIVAPLDSYKHAFTVSQTNGDATAAEVLSRNSNMFLTSAHLPDAPTSSTRANVSDWIYKRGMVPGWYACPLWAGAQILRNPYSKATSGITEITLTAFWNFDILRADAVGYGAWKLA